MAKQSRSAGGGDGLMEWEGGGATMLLTTTKGLIGNRGGGIEPWTYYIPRKHQIISREEALNHSLSLKEALNRYLYHRLSGKRVRRTGRHGQR